MFSNSLRACALSASREPPSAQRRTRSDPMHPDQVGMTVLPSLIDHPSDKDAFVFICPLLYTAAWWATSRQSSKARQTYVAVFFQLRGSPQDLLVVLSPCCLAVLLCCGFVRWRRDRGEGGARWEAHFLYARIRVNRIEMDLWKWSPLGSTREITHLNLLCLK